MLQLVKIRRARAPAPHSGNLSQTSQHLDAFDVDGLSSDLAGNSHVMAFVASQRVGIINGEHLLIAIGDYYQLFACFYAFLGSLGGFGVCAFSAAFGVRHVAVNGG